MSTKSIAFPWELAEDRPSYSSRCSSVSRVLCYVSIGKPLRMARTTLLSTLQNPSLYTSMVYSPIVMGIWSWKKLSDALSSSVSKT